jgi:predicted transcriptional regulator
MKKEPVPTHKKTVYLPPDIDERLRQSAKKNRRSYNSELVWALQQYLDQQESTEKGRETPVPGL